MKTTLSETEARAKKVLADLDLTQNEKDHHLISTSPNETNIPATVDRAPSLGSEALLRDQARKNQKERSEKSNGRSI